MPDQPLRSCTVCGRRFRVPVAVDRWGCRDHPDARPRRPQAARQRHLYCEHDGCNVRRRVPVDSTETTYRCTAHRPEVLAAAAAAAAAEAAAAAILVAPSWAYRGACVGRDPRLWDGEDEADTAAAALVCAGCPVASLCLDYGRGTGAAGVWGGVALAGAEQDEHAA